MQPETLSPIPIEILRARVAEELRAAILRGDLPPGSQVKQEELAAQLRVSREPVRHALLLLQREGLIHARPNRSVIVAPLNRQVISDVYGFREAIEVMVVGRLARLRKFDVQPLLEIIARGRAAVRQGDLSALIRLDMSFHTSLYEAAGNQVTVEVMRGQWSHIRRVMAMVLDRAAYRQKVWDEHEAIVRSISAGSAAAARAAAARHICAARKLLLTIFDASQAANARATAQPEKSPGETTKRSRPRGPEQGRYP